MTKKYYIILFTISILISSCDSLKLRNVNKKNIGKREINKVFFISKNEKINHQGIFIGNIVQKYNQLDFVNGDVDWVKIKKNIVELARNSGGNIVEINTIGYGRKGHLFYLKADLYYENDFKKPTTENSTDCSIVVFRNRLEAPLGTVFRINISIDNESFGALKKDKPIKKSISNCSQKTILKFNNDEVEIELNDNKIKYYKVHRDTGGGSSGSSGISFSVGGLILDEIENSELGELLWLNNFK